MCAYVYVCVCLHVNHSMHVEVGGQLAGVSSFYNMVSSRTQANRRQQVPYCPLPESSHWPHGVLLHFCFHEKKN